MWRGYQLNQVTTWEKQCIHKSYKIFAKTLSIHKTKKKTFDDKQESGSPPHPMSGATIYNKLKDISFSSRNKCGKKLNDKTSNNYWKTRPEFF